MMGRGEEEKRERGRTEEIKGMEDKRHRRQKQIRNGERKSESEEKERYTVKKKDIQGREDKLLRQKGVAF